MRNFILVLLALGLLAVGGYLAYTKLVQSDFAGTSEVANTQRTSLESQQNVVEIQGFAYAPKELKIKVGETVTFINKDFVGHDATGDDGSWKVELMLQGESQTKKFTTPGTYKFHCSPHPWMKGTIVVE